MGRIQRSSALGMGLGLGMGSLNGHSSVSDRICTWTGLGDTSNWSDPDNWDTLSAPRMRDTAVFNGTSVADCTVDPLTVGYVAEVTVDEAYTGTISFATDAAFGHFVQSGGVVVAGGNTLSMHGLYVNESGLFQGNTATLRISGTMDIQNTTQNNFERGTSTVVAHTGDTALAVPWQGDPAGGLYNLTVAAGSTLALQDDVAVVGGTVTFEAGTVLTATAPGPSKFHLDSVTFVDGGFTFSISVSPITWYIRDTPLPFADFGDTNIVYWGTPFILTENQITTGYFGTETTVNTGGFNITASQLRWTEGQNGTLIVDAASLVSIAADGIRGVPDAGVVHALSLSDGVTLSTVGPLEIDGTGDFFLVLGDGAEIIAQGNVSLLGGIDLTAHANSLLTLTGGEEQEVAIVPGAELSNIVVSKTGGYAQQTTDLSLSGAFHVTSGAYRAGAQAIHVGGDFTLDLGAVYVHLAGHRLGVTGSDNQSITFNGQDARDVYVAKTGGEARFMSSFTCESLLCETPGNNLRFAAGSVFTIGALTLNGVFGTLVTIDRMGGAGLDQFTLDLAGAPTVSFASLSNCVSTILSEAAYSVDGGNNVNWAFVTARDYVWNGADDDWATAANWLPNGIPGTNDTVTFDGTSAQACLIPAGTSIAELSLSSGTVDQAGALTVTGTLTISDGTYTTNNFDLTCGTSDGSGGSTGGLIWEGGDLTVGSSSVTAGDFLITAVVPNGTFSTMALTLLGGDVSIISGWAPRIGGVTILPDAQVYIPARAGTSSIFGVSGLVLGAGCIVEAASTAEIGVRPGTLDGGCTWLGASLALVPATSYSSDNPNNTANFRYTSDYRSEPISVSLFTSGNLALSGDTRRVVEDSAVSFNFSSFGGISAGWGFPRFDSAAFTASDDININLNAAYAVGDEDPFTFSFSGAAQVLSVGDDLTMTQYARLVARTNGAGDPIARAEKWLLNGSVAQSISLATRAAFTSTFNANYSNTASPQYLHHVEIDNSDAAVTFGTGFEMDYLTAQPGSELVFTAGETYTINTGLDIVGTSGDPITIRSSVPGTPFTLVVPAGQSIDYVAVSDCSMSVSVDATNSIDGTGNTNINFI